MDPKQTTPDNFKQRILTKYPNGVASDGRKYADIPALELTQKIVEKFPTATTNDGIAYSSFLNPPEKQPTKVGAFIRGVAKIPIQAGLSVAAGAKQLVGSNPTTTIHSKYLGDVSDYITTAKPKIENLTNKVKSGEISKDRALLGAVGVAAEPALDLASFIPGEGVVRAGIDTLAKNQIEKQTLKKALITSAKRGGAFGATYDTAGQLASGEKYKPLQTVENAALGTALDIGLSKVVPAVFKAGINKITSKEAPKVSGLVSKRERELQKLESNNTVIRKSFQKAKEKGIDVKKELANSDLLTGSVDDTGTIRTTQEGGPVSRYKEFIAPQESVISKNLEKEGVNIPLSKVRNKMIAGIERDGIKGADKITAINKIDKEIEGLGLDAKDNSIKLSAVHDAKVYKYANLNYNSETRAIDKSIAKSLKEVVEENTNSIDVKNLNKELAKHYTIIGALEKLDGKKVQGGKLGKYFAQTVGGMVGSHFGPLGTIAGAEAGGRIKSGIFSRTFGGKGGKALETSETMKKAMEKGNAPRLMLPSPKQGAPKSSNYVPIRMPAPSSIEKQAEKIGHSNNFGRRNINQSKESIPTTISKNKGISKNIPPKMNEGKVGLGTAKTVAGATAGAFGYKALASKYGNINYESKQPKPMGVTSLVDKTRGVSIKQNEVEDRLKPILYGELSNRPADKKELEARVIFNTALNRMKENLKRGKEVTLDDILSSGDYQAYKGKEYQKYIGGDLNTLDMKKKEETDAIVNKLIEEIRNGTFKDNTDNAYYYSHADDGSIKYDSKRPLFKKSNFGR